MTGYANEIHSCRVCSKTFPRYVALKRHMLMQHSTGQLFSCEYCNRRFSQKCNMQRHSMMHTGEKPYTCIVCSKGFTQKGNLERHMAIHTGSRPYACHFCDKTFAQSGNLKTHLLRHTGDRPFECHLCAKAFAVKGNLHLHLLRHTDDQCYICEVCNEGFIAEHEYARHTLTHDRRPVYTCEVCLEKFDSEVQVDEHKSIHGSRAREMSGEKLSIKFLVDKDVLLQSTKEELYVCDICKEGFLEKNQLAHHTKTHEQRVNVSKASSEKLKNKRDSNDHFASNAPHVCVACGKKFTRKYSLNRHLRTHTDEHCACNVCGDKFNHHSNFKRHLAVHGNNKPYVCGVCSKGFLQKSNLKRHLSTHSNPHAGSTSGTVQVVKEEDGLMLYEDLYLVDDECTQSPNIDDYVEAEYKIHSPSDVMYVNTREDDQSASDSVKIEERELAPNNQLNVNPHGNEQRTRSDIVYEENVSPINEMFANRHDDEQSLSHYTSYANTNESELSVSDRVLYIKRQEGDQTSGFEAYMQFNVKPASSDDVSETIYEDVQPSNERACTDMYENALSATATTCPSPSDSESATDPQCDNGYMCDHCGDAFTKHVLFKKHLLTHSDHPIIVVVV